MQRLSMALSAAFFFLCFILSNALAQMPASSSTTSTPVPGVGHDYLGEVGETVNPVNGSVSLRLNTTIPRGRGLTIPFSFAYDSNGVNYVGNGTSSTLQWLSPSSSVTSSGGWSNTVPVITVSEPTWTAVDYNGHNVHCHAFVNYEYQDAHGNRHNLNLTTYYPLNGACAYDDADWPSGFDAEVVTQGGEVPNTGGSILASIPANASLNSGPITVADADGTTLHFPSAGYRGALATSIEDRNGNVVTINPPVSPATNYSYVDSAGRTVLQDTGFAVSPESVTIAGNNAAYSLVWTALATPTFSTPNTILSGNSCPFTHAGYFPTQYVISSLTLPNKKSFLFTYDSTYNVLKKITYPTGGYIQYVWGMNNQAEVGTASTTQTNAQCTALYAVPVITDRYVSFDGSTNVLHQHFSYSTTWQGANWTAKQTTVTTTDLVRSTSYNTVYNYSSLAADVPPNTLYGPTCCNPVESSILYYDTDGTLLKTVSKTWANPRLLTSQTTTYPGGQANETTWSYNSREQQTEQDDYDFGSSGVGSLLRKVVTNYQGFGNTPLYPNSPSIVDRPCQVITYDSTGTTRVAETDYFYDNGVTTTPCGATGTPLVTSAGGSSLTGHDETNFSASSTYPRGNLTQKTQWLNSGGSSPVSTYTYDTTGQTLSMTDPNGNTTTYSYADSYVSTNTTGYTTTAGSPPSGEVTNAFLTGVTHATVNSIALTENYSYGYNDGELTKSTDENSNTTTFKYNDSLGRLTETDYPDTGQTTLNYNDSTPSVTSTKLITSSVNFNTTTLMDGLGHSTQTQLTTDPDGTTYTVSSYDGNGRRYQLYNPTRCSPPTTKCTSEATSWGVSTYTYDALGRVKSVAEPDGSAATTSYSANQTTVTDEIGNQRTSQLDGLGRMTDVWEAPNNTGYNFHTQYVYDALNNLTGVTQNGSNSANARIRTFVYDSLARLTSANNPESGTIQYAYDGNGNILTKTAPAPNHSSGTIQTSYTYDALNRLTQKSYNDGHTPTVQYGFDEYALTGCTTTPPSLTDALPKGRRTAMCDGSGATSWSHDTMGRTATLTRTIGGATRSASYQYNLDGSLALETIFSGKQVQYAYGGAGRILSVTDPSNNPVFNFVTNATYAPNGALASAVYGAVTGGFAGITESDIYNNRLQPILRSATSSAGTAISLCYDFHLGVKVNSAPCSFAAGSGDNGNVFQIVNNRDTTRSQNFTYDKLNRITSAYTTSSLWGTTYVVDPWGNLTNMNGIAGKTNSQNLQAAPATLNNQLNGFCSDAAGNLVFYTACPAPPWSMTTDIYDAENRLKTAFGATYVYDGDGNRVEKLISGSGTIYWRESDGELTNETDTNNVTLHRHVYFNGRRVARTDTQPNTTQHYYFSDHLGSANVVTDASGNIEEDSDYYPYGGEVVFTNNVPQNYKFTGKERDSESSLDYFGFRHYASTMGRFMTPDDDSGERYGDPQSWNLYSYVRNNPLRNIDPTGHACVQGSDGSYHNDNSGGETCEQVNQNNQQAQAHPNDTNSTTVRATFLPTEMEYRAAIASESYPQAFNLLRFSQFVRRGQPVVDAYTFVLLMKMGGPEGSAEGSAEELLAARPAWAGTPGGFVNWLKNLQKAGTPLSAEQADAIIGEAKSLGVDVRLDPPHAGTNWDVPHLNIGGNGQVHLEVPAGYTNPGVAQGHP